LYEKTHIHTIIVRLRCRHPNNSYFYDLVQERAACCAKASQQFRDKIRNQVSCVLVAFSRHLLVYDSTSTYVADRELLLPCHCGTTSTAQDSRMLKKFECLSFLFLLCILVTNVLPQLLPKLKAFQPDLLIVSAGFDGHRDDFYHYLGEV